MAVFEGTPGSDVYTGGDDPDTIRGHGGHDVLDGGGGNDLVEGDAGNDDLRGGAGRDRVDGGDGNDVIHGGADGDFLAGETGNDWVSGEAGNDNVSGGDGNDVVLGGDGNDNVDGDDGNDVLFGGAGGDDIVAGDGNDILWGDAGDDDLQGGAGNDLMMGGDGDDDVTGYEGVDINIGGAGADNFGFFLGSFAPSSTLAAQDIVLDFEGAGVEGGDTINLNFETVAFGGEIDIRVREGALLPGAGDGVVQLFYTQRRGSTWLIADENDNGVLDDSDFTVEFVGTHDFTPDDFIRTDFVIVGTAGDDELIGTEDGDRIFGAGGDDEITGLGGDDELNGGDGDDFLDGGPGGFDMLNGDAGNDTLTLATSDNGGVAFGGEGDDTLFGSDIAFFSDLQGGAGNDVINAGAVNAFMSGGDGADRLVSGAGDDQLNGGVDENFLLDGDPDQFVYGAGPWGTDDVYQFEDGVDLFDLRGSGLTFEDLEITNEDFMTTITSANGTIFINESFDGPVEITAADFIFG